VKTAGQLGAISRGYTLNTVLYLHLIHLLVLQFMVTGVAGLHGQTVTNLVIQDLGREIDCAITLYQLMAEKLVTAQPPTPSYVI